MTHRRLSHRLLCALVLPSLALPLAAGGATGRHPRPRAAVPAAAAASNAIIPLPLNPVVPAGQRLCAARTPAGLGYTILRAAAGAKPAAGDLVLVNYIGYLAATGAVFDQGMRAAFPVGGVIPGFSQGLQMMAKGSVARFCIPAALGYGAAATGPIPANADLVFQVELLDTHAGGDAGAGTEETPATPAPSGTPTPDAAPPR